MKRAWMILAAAVSPALAGPLLQNALNRHSISLNGEWHAIVDSRDGGLSRRYYRNADPFTEPGVVEYDFATAPVLRVPGDWNSQWPELLLYEGTVWYQRTFSYHLETGHHAFFHVGAANYRAQVWMNGEALCEHEGGFTPFDCDATSLLKDGENVVVVSVNNARHADDIPARDFDWWNYGGLTRDVSLMDVRAAYIENYSLQLERGSATRISGWIKINGAGPQVVTVRIPDLQVTQTAMTDSSGMARLAFDSAGLERWSPERPRLYAVEIASGGDRVTDEIGFRTIEARGTEILLNGRPVFLRGISLHEEAPNRSGRAHGDDDARILFGWAKELGCNFVRLAHYPHDEHAIRLADRLGLLLWSEIPLWQAIDFGNAAVVEKARQQLNEMIERDRNRAAVIFWSLTNESRATPERNAAVHQLAATARSLDSTRLITAATNQISRPDPHTMLLDDPIIADLDVFGVNEYIGWYQGLPADLDTMTWRNPFNKPMVVSEFGGDAKQGFHGEADQRWTEEYQENIYNHQIAAIRKLPFARGLSPWILKDFRSPVRQLSGIQDGYNRKGLVSDTGERKKAFFVLQKYYQELAAGTEAASGR
ncbi:MAG: beta galactosidase jelly roll domain-containing protein [Acidobacteriia bacterium]|nr:beta galactosidase jelly roll domain-containing protein [Terriglobia bacterium]